MKSLAMIASLVLVSSTLASESRASSWEKLVGTYETPDDDLCPKLLKINHQNDGSNTTIFAYDISKTPWDRLFVMMEGEWVNGSRTLYSYEFRNSTGHFFSSLEFAENMKLVKETKIKAVDEDESKIDFFRLSVADHSVTSNLNCAYIRQD